MIKEDFLKIIGFLKDLNYFFISGFAVHVYSNGKRIFKDLDLVVHPRDIQILVNGLGCNLEKRLLDKGTFIVEDIGFEFNIRSQPIEATSGYPPNRMKNKTFYKLFDKRIAKKFFGEKVFLAPLEEIIAYKALTFREKDKQDLILLRSNKINNSLLIEISKDLDSSHLTLKNLKSQGYLSDEIL